MGIESGLVALQTRPFTEVVLPKAQSLQVLTAVTRANIHENAAYLLADSPLVPGHPLYREHRSQVTELRDAALKIEKSGGSSLADRELDIIYGRWGGITFSGVNRRLVEDVFPDFDNWPNLSREPAVVNMGCVLDLIRMINPDVASFNDGVACFAQVLRDSRRISPLTLGAMVDDTMRLTSPDGLPDIVADRAGAMRFRDSYLKSASAEEAELFRLGLDVVFIPIRFGTDPATP